MQSAVIMNVVMLNRIIMSVVRHDQKPSKCKILYLLKKIYSRLTLIISNLLIVNTMLPTCSNGTGSTGMETSCFRFVGCLKVRSCLSVVMLNVVMLNVVAPARTTFRANFKITKLIKLKVIWLTDRTLTTVVEKWNPFLLAELSSSREKNKKIKKIRASL
jgi:hypothetical protein